jgi:hypothetical protein
MVSLCFGKGEGEETHDAECTAVPEVRNGVLAVEGALWWCC